MRVSIYSLDYWLETHLAEGIKHLVEVYEYLAFCDLCNVVHALACIVPDARI